MESWDLYNAEGVFQGVTIQRGEEIPEGFFHRIVHIWIYNENQEFLVQKRAAHLTWFPNRWAATTGSILSGELDTLAAAYRELEEELGLNATKIDLEMEKEYVFGSLIISFYSGFLPSNLIAQIRLSDEVTDIKWMKKNRIEELRKDKKFAAYNQETFDTAYRILAKF